jgi:hypothetical protein
LNTKLIFSMVIIVAVIAVGFWRYRNSQAQITPDGQVIAQLRSAGSDVTKPHAIDFFFYFPTQAAADRIVPQLLTLGVTGKVDHAAQGPQWVIQGQKTMVPGERELLRLRREFETIVATEGGEYDGWGTEIVK